MLEQRRLRPGEVVLRELGDELEQSTTLRVIEELWRKCLSGGQQPGKGEGCRAFLLLPKLIAAALPGGAGLRHLMFLIPDGMRQDERLEADWLSPLGESQAAELPTA